MELDINVELLFTTFNKHDHDTMCINADTLEHAGMVSHGAALKLAEEEYQKFRLKQDKRFESDFDQKVKKFRQKGERRNEFGKRADVCISQMRIIRFRERLA